jgi:hypothetical protein
MKEGAIAQTSELKSQIQNMLSYGKKLAEVYQSQQPR